MNRIASWWIIVSTTATAGLLVVLISGIFNFHKNSTASEAVQHEKINNSISDIATLERDTLKHKLILVRVQSNQKHMIQQLNKILDKLEPKSKYHNLFVEAE